MRISTRFSDAIHLICFLDIYQNQKLTSDFIASSIQTSAVMVRQIMIQLRKAGLLKTTKGTANPQITRPLDEISLYDVYLAIEEASGPHPLFEIDYDTNPNCIVGGNIQGVLESYYEDAKQAAMAKLQQRTIADVVNQIKISQSKKELKQRQEL
ncbi:Rrf2 family transcriptional regulator [uncultured Limosilactobacillus sp.]|uniref:Rrf2 family transcriptional regulator n=1 Tax=uncultured Limosilactobacillus sp. TaxID=2837629 RepID=UPI0025D110EB|nr:Rrf2 family transcriptional regulator [uncultured Limosilactobacillus sp.]